MDHAHVQWFRAPFFFLKTCANVAENRQSLRIAAQEKTEKIQNINCYGRRQAIGDKDQLNRVFSEQAFLKGGNQNSDEHQTSSDASKNTNEAANGVNGSIEHSERRSDSVNAIINC